MVLLVEKKQRVTGLDKEVFGKKWTPERSVKEREWGLRKSLVTMETEISISRK